MNREYLRFIADLKIVNKENNLVPFDPNPVQHTFLTEDYQPKSIILKARQQGFSTLINAVLTMDFLTKPHTYNMVVADDEDNALGLLTRVRKLIQSWETTNSITLKLSTDSKYHLRFNEIDCDYVIGTAKNADLGRSRTITNLHLSEVSRYPHLQEILAGAGQAVTSGGRIIMETTANGYNEFKSFWDKSKRGETGYTPLFYKASDFYSADFLDKKRAELGDIFPQEYPENDIECFLSSGSNYFDTKSLQEYLKKVQSSPIS